MINVYLLLDRIGEDCLNCEEMKFCFQYDIKHNFYNKYLALVFDYMSE